MQRRIVSLLAGSALLAGTALAAAGAAAGAAVASGAPATAPSPVPVPVPLAHVLSGVFFLTPPTTAQCEEQLGIACYAPFQYHEAYNLAPLYDKGFDGQGYDLASGVGTVNAALFVPELVAASG